MSVSPRFSILIPSRNRPELLDHALASVLDEDAADVEIIVSDNASQPPYGGLSGSDLLRGGRVRLLRQERGVSVTANWNLALAEARGDYILMLGDDDALAPGFFKRMRDTLAKFGEPDVVYFPAFHYAYPDVVPDHPAGFLWRVDNSVLFRSEISRRRLAASESRRLGEMALSFRHHVSFNAQHFLYSRRWINQVSHQSEFYKTNYPDYYVAFFTFLLSPNLVVDQKPAVIIGISPKSYGFYHLNGKFEEGAAQFLAEGVEGLDLARQSPAAMAALELPGSAHTRKWLVAALAASQAPGVGRPRVDLRRYRRIQAVDTAISVALGAAPHRKLVALRSTFPSAQVRLADLIYYRLRGLGRGPVRQARDEAARLQTSLGVYLAPVIEPLPLREHRSIADARVALSERERGAGSLMNALSDLAARLDDLALADGVTVEAGRLERELAEARSDIARLQGQVRTLEATVADVASPTATGSLDPALADALLRHERDTSRRLRERLARAERELDDLRREAPLGP